MARGPKFIPAPPREDTSVAVLNAVIQTQTLSDRSKRQALTTALRQESNELSRRRLQLDAIRTQSDINEKKEAQRKEGEDQFSSNTLLNLQSQLNSNPDLMTVDNLASMQKEILGRLDSPTHGKTFQALNKWAGERQVMLDQFKVFDNRKTFQDAQSKGTGFMSTDVSRLNTDWDFQMFDLGIDPSTGLSKSGVIQDLSKPANQSAQSWARTQMSVIGTSDNRSKAMSDLASNNRFMSIISSTPDLSKEFNSISNDIRDERIAGTERIAAEEVTKREEVRGVDIKIAEETRAAEAAKEVAEVKAEQVRLVYKDPFTGSTITEIHPNQESSDARARELGITPISSEATAEAAQEIFLAPEKKVEAEASFREQLLEIEADIRGEFEETITGEDRGFDFFGLAADPGERIPALRIKRDELIANAARAGIDLTVRVQSEIRRTTQAGEGGADEISRALDAIR